MQPKLKLGAVHMPASYKTNFDRRVENKDGAAYIPANSSIIFICAQSLAAYRRTLHRACIALNLYD